MHGAATPLGGGVAVYSSWVLTVLIFGLSIQLDGNQPYGYWTLILSAGLFCFAGLWDDKYDVPARRKLLVQVVACLPYVLAGRAVSEISLLGLNVPLGWLSIPITILWLVACVNAFNLIDGMDGLASSFGTIAIATLAVLALMAGQLPLAVISFCAASCIVGFLLHNWPPARIFLGDAGSCTIGFLVAAFSIEASQKTATGYMVIVPLTLAALPLFDTGMAILRRRLAGRPIAEADRGHLHHGLLDRGLSPRQTLLLLIVLSLALSASTLLTFTLRNEYIALGTCAVVLVALVAGRLFGHREIKMLWMYARRRRQSWRPSAVSQPCQALEANGPSTIAFPEGKKDFAPDERRAA